MVWSFNSNWFLFHKNHSGKYTKKMMKNWRILWKKSIFFLDIFWLVVNRKRKHSFGGELINTNSKIIFHFSWKTFQSFEYIQPIHSNTVSKILQKWWNLYNQNEMFHYQLFKINLIGYKIDIQFYKNEMNSSQFHFYFIKKDICFSCGMMLSFFSLFLFFIFRQSHNLIVDFLVIDC